MCENISLSLMNRYDRKVRGGPNEEKGRPFGPAFENENESCQSACKPGSVWPQPELRRDGHSSATDIAAGLKQPTRTGRLEPP